MTYNTGNPVPSLDPRDLDDNAEAFDRLMNSLLAQEPDRFGVPRLTWKYVEDAATALVQPNLIALANLSGEADRLPYFTGAGAMSLATLTAFSRTLLAAANASAARSTLGLVPTTSQVDTTAGRLLKVADFGVGGYAPTITDLDTYNFGAFGTITASQATAAGLPLAVGHIIESIPGGSSVVGVQFAYPLTSVAGNRNRMFKRQEWASGWSGWDEVQFVTPSSSAIAGLTPAANTFPYFTGANAAALATLTASMRAMLALTGATDRLPYFNGSTTAALATFTTFARSLLDDADAATGRATLNAAQMSTEYVRGLQLQWVSGTALTVGTGSAYIPSLGTSLDVPAAVALTGLSLTASTLYHVYLYSNAGTPALEVVTTSPAPAYRGTARTKTGDTTRRYLGSVYNLATGGLAPFIHDLATSKIQILQAPFGGPFMVLNGGQATAQTNVSCAAVVSPSAVTVSLQVINGATASGVLNFGASGFTSYQNLDFNQRGWVEIPLNSSLQFSYNYSATPSGGTASAFFTITSYTFGR